MNNSRASFQSLEIGTKSGTFFPKKPQKPDKNLSFQYFFPSLAQKQVLEKINLRPHFEGFLCRFGHLCRKTEGKNSKFRDNLERS